MTNAESPLHWLRLAAMRGRLSAGGRITNPPNLASLGRIPWTVDTHRLPTSAESRR